MISYIPGPEGSANTHILLEDIVGVSTSELRYFNNKAYNLYVLVTKENNELFYLFVYSSKEQMKEAFEKLSSIVATDMPQGYVVNFSPAVPT